MYVVILDPSRSLVVHHILNTHYVVLPQYVNIYDTLWPMSAPDTVACGHKDATPSKYLLWESGSRIITVTQGGVLLLHMIDTTTHFILLKGLLHTYIKCFGT